MVNDEPDGYRPTLLHPALTLADLKSAYEALRQATTVAGNPLVSFVLVQQRLNQPATVRGEAGERQAVFGILLEILAGEFRRIRALYNLSAPDIHASFDQALDDIQRDGQQSNELLIGYSALYHRYVRADLDLSMKTIADNLFQDERTLRRRVSTSWNHLLGLFIRMERQARQEDRQRRARLALPNPELTVLSTQQEAVEDVYQRLAHGVPGSVAIYGPPGIGKSTIALRLSRKLVDHHLVDAVAWVPLRRRQYRSSEGGPSGEDLAAAVCETLLLASAEGMSFTQIIQGYIHVLARDGQRLLIVVDDADRWAPVFEEGAIWLDHCYVIVISQLPYANWMGFQMRCPDLDEGDYSRFLQFLLKHAGRDIQQLVTDRFYAATWQAVGGNPGQIRRALRLLGSIPPGQLGSALRLDDYYRRVWWTISSESRLVWVCLDVLSHVSEVTYVEVEGVMRTLFNLVDMEAFARELVDTGFVEIVPQDDRTYSYRIPVDLAGLIEVLRGDSLTVEEVRRVVSRLLVEPHPKLCYALLHARGYHVVLAEQIIKLSGAARNYVETVGSWEQWFVLLNELSEDRLFSSQDRRQFLLFAAVALRWMGQFSDAIRLLGRIPGGPEHWGPSLAARVAAERSTIQVYQGEIASSLESTLQAYRLMPDDDDEGQFLVEIALLRAYIGADLEMAGRLAERVVFRHPVVWDLVSRLELARGNYEAAVRAAEVCLAEVDVRNLSYPRALANLGVVCLYAGAYRRALGYLERSVNLLQVVHRDVVGLARVFNNCGVAFMRSGDVERALSYFERSLLVHDGLDDGKGREVAKLNLSLVRGGDGQGLSVLL
ncbi:MAG: ATP-binding protein [Chloroflexi bacterium]|nr:ATP-binding protein [Chloroflexota bacterium]